MQQQDEIAAADQLLAEWRAQAAERLPAEGSMVRRMLEKGLQESEALVDKVKQAGEMRKQIEGLPAGVVKVHMSKALGQLEAELAATVGGPEEDGTGSGKGTMAAPGKNEEAAATPSSSGDATYKLLAERLAQVDNSVQVKGPKDALALAVHVLLQEEGFVCYGEEEQKGGSTGFAAPIRPVLRSRLVPPRWNADPANVCFTYRHDGLKGRDIKLKMLWMDEERVVLELQDTGSGGKTTTMTINGPEYVKIGSTSSSSGGGHPTNTNSTNPLAHFHPSHLNPLASSIHTGFVAELLPTPTAGAGAGAGRGAVLPTPTPPPSSVSQGQQQRPPFDIPVPDPLGPMVPPGYAGYGRRGGGLVPDFEGDMQPGGGWGGPGEGNLMGPGHPIFTGGRGGGIGEGGALGMPQPRFDPYGPVIPPTRGGPPMPPGRGGVIDPNDPRGRGRAFREPDPDHLPPPGPPGTFGNAGRGGGRGGGGGGNFYF